MKKKDKTEYYLLLLYIFYLENPKSFQITIFLPFVQVPFGRMGDLMPDKQSIKIKLFYSSQDVKEFMFNQYQYNICMYRIFFLEIIKCNKTYLQDDISKARRIFFLLGAYFICKRGRNIFIRGKIKDVHIQNIIY